jgi:hypothetical protein
MLQEPFICIIYQLFYSIFAGVRVAEISLEVVRINKVRLFWNTKK